MNGSKLVFKLPETQTRKEWIEATSGHTKRHVFIAREEKSCGGIHLCEKRRKRNVPGIGLATASQAR